MHRCQARRDGGAPTVDWRGVARDAGACARALVVAPCRRTHRVVVTWRCHQGFRSFRGGSADIHHVAGGVGAIRAAVTSGTMAAAEASLARRILGAGSHGRCNPWGRKSPCRCDPRADRSLVEAGSHHLHSGDLRRKIGLAFGRACRYRREETSAGGTLWSFVGGLEVPF